MLKIASVVILYNSDLKIIDNIHSYLNHIDLLIILENSVNKNQNLLETIGKISNKILLINNPTNFGIARCLNIAAKIAMDRGYDWLLTMDQDSAFADKNIERYFIQLEKAVNLYDRLSMLSCETEENKKVNTEFEVTRSAITSGSILNVKVWATLGGFDEKLFIDEVDTEYVFKSMLNNYQIIKCPNIVLKHRLGTAKKIGYFYLFYQSERIIHSPTRVYYMVRNYFYIKGKYNLYFPEDLKLRKKQLLISIKNNLLFSGQPLKVLYNIIDGYLDYKKGKYN